jgi:hypothetical protein
MTRRSQATIPFPTASVESLRECALSNKELTEVLAGQRGSPLDAAVTWGDLVEIGVVKPEQVPRDIGSNTGQ